MSYIRKTASDILGQIQDVFKNVFGASVTTTPSSTVGVFSQELTNIGVEVENTRVELYSNVYDPYYSSGKYLDGIAAFHQITRSPATKSTAICNITGLSGVVIPIGGATILNASGDQFKNTTIINIIGGFANDIGFEAVNSGVIPVIINSLNRIANPIPGFDTVNNPTNGIIGTTVESDTSFRLKRGKSLYFCSAGNLRSIISALEQNANVIDYNIFENYTNETISTPATILAKSLYLVVYLRSEADEKLTEIAEILYLRKSAGCGMTGKARTYVDPIYSWEVYTTRFDQATEVPIEMHINVNQSATTTQSTTTDIQNAIKSSFLGEDGSVPVQMGIPFSVSKFYPAVINQGIFIINSFTMNIIGDTPGQIITTAFIEAATLDVSNINVVIVPS